MSMKTENLESLFGASPADLIDNGYIELVTKTYSFGESVSVGDYDF